MIAEVVTVGNEILSGRTLDSNLAWLARELETKGARVLHHQTVSDDVERIASALKTALRRARLVIVTGGLGPTPDDLTRKGVSQALGRPLALDHEVLEQLRTRWDELGGKLPMPPNNELQALVPHGARPLANPVGSAPGLQLEEEGSTLFVLPGVPSEMKAIAGAAILPWLDRHREQAIEYLTLRTTGIRESVLAQRLAEFEGRLTDCTIAYLPSLGSVDVRVRLPSGPPQRVAALRDEVRRAIGEAIGDYVYAEGLVSLEETIGELLVERGYAIALAESCTGGLLAERLTSIPGSSRYVRLGLVCYSDEAKVSLAGVPASLLSEQGAVSEAVARALARGAVERSGAEVGVGITGIAGPTGGSEAKPVGTVHVAAVAPEGERHRRHRFPGSREAVRRRSATVALEMVRRLLLGLEG